MASDEMDRLQARYFGVFAPASKLRAKIVKPEPEKAKEAVDDGGAETLTLGYALP